MIVSVDVVAEGDDKCAQVLLVAEGGEWNAKEGVTVFLQADDEAVAGGCGGCYLTPSDNVTLHFVA